MALRQHHHQSSQCSVLIKQSDFPVLSWLLVACRSALTDQAVFMASELGEGAKAPSL